MSRRYDGPGSFPGTQGKWSSDLERLDRNLREIVIEERTSFEAELRAELAAEYGRLLSGWPVRSARRRWPRLAAAAVVLLLMGASLIPAARASLVRLLFPAPESAEPVTVAQPAEPSTVVSVVLPERPSAVPEERVLPEMEESAEVSAPLPEPHRPVLRDEPLPPPPTLPALQDLAQARRTVAEEYPVALQEAGIGGAVRVLVWVGPDGTAETPRVRNSSGVSELDEAAMRATRALEFVPATRSGRTVGTWVEFSIRFLPNAAEDQPAPEYQAFEIPPIN
ncbi:MAG: TonB family protein [Gemmatimonadota bacterium]|nr:TonB family protein [Gemmatimonadota bacterium]